MAEPMSNPQELPESKRATAFPRGSLHDTGITECPPNIVASIHTEESWKPDIARTWVKGNSAEKVEISMSGKIYEQVLM